jgi:hypothetical protein
MTPPKKKNKALVPVICLVVLAAGLTGAYFLLPDDVLNSLPLIGSGSSGDDSSPPTPPDDPLSPMPPAPPPSPTPPNDYNVPEHAAAEAFDDEVVLPTPEELADVLSDNLLRYYLSYLHAINAQDASLLENVTSFQAENLYRRIYEVNSGYLFTLNQIILDLDSIEVYTREDTIGVSLYAQFDFSRVSRSGGSVIVDSNIQSIDMVCDNHWAAGDDSWLVDHSHLVADVEISQYRRVITP